MAHVPEARRFEGKVAIVTGGGSGIGAATALRFAEEGAAVTIAGRAEHRCAETIEKITQGGGQAIFTRTDVSRAADAEACVARTLEAFGRVDFLFNNAGVHRFGNVETLAESDWDELIDTMLKGTFLMSKYAVPQMRAVGGGAIVNSGSDCAHRGCPDMVGYVAAKAAMPVLTQAMAVDLWPDHIRVNCISPGFVYSDMAVSVFAKEHDRPPTPDEYGTWQPARGIADSVLFLCSDDQAEDITGVTLPVSRLALAAHP
jgi:NAD(P)-dependent dehydrogenase (short-subunit alcohol dehydrogenase family)